MKILKFLTVIAIAAAQYDPMVSADRHHDCIRDENDSRYDGDHPCITDDRKRLDGECVTDKNDSRYNPYDICLTSLPIVRRRKPKYQGQARRAKFKNLKANDHDPNDSRYSGGIKGDYVRDPNDSRYEYLNLSGGFPAPNDLQDRHQDADYNGDPIPDNLGWH